MTNYFRIYHFKNKFNLVLSSTFDMKLLAVLRSCHQQEIFLIRRSRRIIITSFTPSAEINGAQKSLSVKFGYYAFQPK